MANNLMSSDQKKMAMMNRLAAALNLHSIDSYLNLATGFVCGSHTITNI